MKKPEEIKKGLSMCTHGADCGQCPYTLLECSRNQMEQDALALIQQLEAQNVELLKKVDKLEEANKNFVNLIHGLAAQVPEWTSVEERLPDKNEKVLIRGVRGGIQAGIFRGTCHDTNNHLWDWKKNDVLEVVFWMSQDDLPEPPKEDEI